MHRLKIRLTSADGELPEDLSVEVRNRNEGSFSLFTGTPQDPETDEVWITPHAGEQAGEFTALLFPQKLAPYTSGDGWLRIHAGDRTIMYNAPNEIGGSKSFEAGKTTTLDLRLTDGNVEPDPGLEPDEEFRNKKLWLYGIDSPVYDPETVIEVSPGNPIDNYTPNVWVKYVYHWSDGTTTESWKLPWGKAAVGTTSTKPTGRMMPKTDTCVGGGFFQYFALVDRPQQRVCRSLRCQIRE